MKVKVKVFASLRERLGFAERELDVTAGSTVTDLWAMVAGSPELPADVLAAVNMDYAKGNAVLTPGDEVAFFPPVTGG
jgi:molybdopterin synthase sulfur carrier subunit